MLLKIFSSSFKCNNPQTKEPKLDQAVRIVPEWKDYDNEIKALVAKWQAENKSATQVFSTTTPATSNLKIHYE